MLNKRLSKNIVAMMEALHKVGAISAKTLESCRKDLQVKVKKKKTPKRTKSK